MAFEGKQMIKQITYINLFASYQFWYKEKYIKGNNVDKWNYKGYFVDFAVIDEFSIDVSLFEFDDS